MARVRRQEADDGSLQLEGLGVEQTQGLGRGNCQGNTVDGTSSSRAGHGGGRKVLLLSSVHDGGRAVRDGSVGIRVCLRIRRCVYGRRVR